MARRSLRSWLWQVPLDDEVDEEIAFHLEMRTRELIARGIDPATARDMAAARLGDVRRIKRTCVDLGRRRDREMRIIRWLEAIREDTTFALRQMKVAPLFTVVAAVTLALGIGANSAIFALADATFFRALPFAEPTEQLVMIWERRQNGFTSMAAPLEARDWREQNRTFTAMAAFAQGPRTITALGRAAEQVRAQTVTIEFFDVLGVRPIAGRTFVAADVTPTPNVVVLSEGFWRRQLGGDPTVVGRDIVIDQQPHTVVGIMPVAFQILPPFASGGIAGSEPSSFWTLAGSSDDPSGRISHYVHAVGRLRPGVTLETAHLDVQAIAGRIASDFPATSQGHGVAIELLRDALIGPEVRLTSTLLLVVVGFVLLMCCANVANLLLARTTSRTRELAVRSAIGAGRGRLAAQLLIESLVLAAIGGGLGLAVGAAIVNAAPSIIPPGLLPNAVTLTFDGRVMAFCAATALLVGVLFGLAPMWHSAHAPLTSVMAAEGRATSRVGGLRSFLVIGEVAAAVLVLCAAGLLLRTWMTLDRVDPGYGADEVLTMTVNLPMQGGAFANRYDSQDALRQFYMAVEREIAGQPGVREVGWGGALPLDGIWYMQLFDVIGNASRSAADRDAAGYHLVSPGYFEVLGLPIVKGRSFTDTDSGGAPPVCIVNEEFVRRFLGGRDPLGTRLVVPMMTFGGEPPAGREIVGVVKQVKGRPDEIVPQAQIYVPIAQNAWYQASLVVRPESGPADALLGPVRAAIARVDSERAVTRVRTLDDIAAEATSRPRFRAVLVATFAALALVLAVVGVFGVLALSVQQRSREFGVRIALGASTTNVLGLVLGAAARLIAAGVVLGLAGAAGAGQWIAAFLFGVQPIDPVTFACVVGVLFVTAAIATAAPAWRAARVDPVVAFRDE